MREQRKSVLVLAMAAFMAMILFVPGLSLAGELLGGIEGWEPKRAWVEKTGQTIIYAPGDDGDFQKGVAWPVPRFRDNGNGTVTDRLTGLIWLKNANCFGTMEWGDALSVCNDLADGQCGLTDGSEPGDWRLPNIKEFQSPIHFGYYYPALPNTEGTGQWTEGDPFTGVQSGFYWSSTTLAYYAGFAWSVGLAHFDVDFSNKSPSYFVWPVRGRQ